MVEARNLRDCETFGNMNSYCLFEESAGGKKIFTTKPVSQGDRFPKWNEKFTHDVLDTEKELIISVFDKETVGSDDLAGSIKVKYSDLCVDKLDKWFKLEFKGKPAGEVHLEAKYTPN